MNDTQFCERCGAQIPLHVPTCPSCGTRQPEPVGVASSPGPAPGAGPPVLDEQLQLSLPSMPQAAGFFRSLFDFKFDNLVTPKIIRLLYGIQVVLAVLFYLVVSLGLLSQNSALGVGYLLIVGPIVMVLYLVFGRVLLEVVIAQFKTAQNTSRMVELMEFELSTRPRPE